MAEELNFEAAYSKAIETGWDSVKDLARQIWDKAQAQAAPEAEPLGWHTEDHLTDKSATTYSKEVAERWRGKGWPVTPFYSAAPQHDAELVAQVVGRVHHNQDHAEPVRAVLNSIGRSLSDHARLYSSPQQDVELINLLRDSAELIKCGDFDTGYCCCGGEVVRHGMGDGHSPVDDGAYHASQLIERIDAKLSTLSAKNEGGKA